MANNQKQVSGWTGWVYFAGFMLIISGFLQMIDGLVSLLDPKFYVVANNALIAFNYHTWGFVDLFVGLFVLLAGMAVIGGHAWGRFVAIFLAILSTFAHFAFIPAYPIWSILMIVVNVLVIFALTVHGQETEV